MSQQLRDWAKEALEMLNDNHHLVADNEKHAYVMLHLDVIERGKALLEQPAQVQEPVAWYRDEDGIRIYYDTKCWEDATPLYTTPPAQPAPVQEPVATLEDLEQEIYENTRQFVSRDVMEWMLKRYYTTPPAQPEPVQEPDAVVTGYYGGNCVVTPTNPARVFNTGTVLYTTPPAQPADHLRDATKMVDHGDELTIAYMDGVHTGKKISKREWVGLDGLEMSDLWLDTPFDDCTEETFEAGRAFIEAIEAKLREKNGGAT
jgi:hypothetical protein